MENIRDGRCGKTCRERCPLSMGRISAASSKASSASKTPRQMFLCRKADAGCTRARSWATVILSPGASSTPRRVGASHKDGNVYLLSSILMDNVPERFSLSPKACQGMERFFETVTNVENAIGKAVDGLIFAADRLTFSTLPETSDTATLRCFATLCAMMNKQAITQQRIQAKEITAENEKYAMRIWLLRLGMNGPEYKEERRILMENLSGHAAFRTEEDKVRWQARQNEKRDALRAAKQMEVTDDADAE